ncbi:DUF2780 domain-containing protein [Pseudomonas sp. TCU-HL1]|uniref:DUF2780 domain-containing protein n=1 Tax=Pseudomonas sp. TCU-HL1 TaxID=1856685 RepID=UPI00083D2E24|nr:DUF2780 domain-containing protein [Pseudomonas sp. TCU-HL1]AOE82958.1 hypothetical protein THL1_410 [Pseudomonas sp. TCU-HL1]
MHIPRSLTLAALLSLAASPVFAVTLGDVVAAAAASGAGSREEQAPGIAPAESAALLEQLGGQLQITPEQALGGAAALFGLARNNLPADQFAQLDQAVPGVGVLTDPNTRGLLSSIGGLLGQQAGNTGALGSSPGVLAGQPMNSMADVGQAFGSLGMDSGLIGQFAPLILSFLGQQGLANNLLESLGNLWKWTIPPVTPGLQQAPVQQTPVQQMPVQPAPVNGLST